LRNRAKCKLCGYLIESFHRYDYVSCECGEIAVDGGKEYYKVMAKNYDNFIRIDDMGNEVPIKVLDEADNSNNNTNSDNDIINDSDKLSPFQTFVAMKENLDALPEFVKDEKISYRELSSILAVLIEILKK